MGDPYGPTAYNNDWEACAAPVKQWFSEYAASNLPCDPTDPPSDPPSGAPVSGESYRITPRHSGKALDAAWGGTENGTNVQQWEWVDNTAQTWRVTDVGNGYYRISPLNNTDNALDLYNWDTSDGANINLWQWGDQPNQHWELIDRGDGYYSLRNRHSDKCLDVDDMSTDNGVNIHQWSCWNGENQQFSFSHVNKSEDMGEPIDPFSSEAILSNNQVKTENQVSIFPNPAESDQLTIRLNSKSLDGLYTINILDIQGRLVYTQSFNHQQEITLNTGLDSGMYILQIENDSKMINMEKFLIK